MELGGIKSFLLRHVEKIVLAATVVFVCHQVYATLFRGEVVQPQLPGPKAGAVAMPRAAVGDWFRRTAAPFVVVPKIEGAKYNWFYPPATRWLRRAELEEGKATEARRVVHGRVQGKPIVTPLNEDDRKDLGIPEAPPILKQPCELDVGVERGKESDTLVMRGLKPGSWVRVLCTLENQDRVCVAVIMFEEGTASEYVLAKAKILEIKEEPLGTVVIRFTAPQGSIKSGKRITNFIEPTYYEILRQGPRDEQGVAIGRVEGRFPKKPEPGAAGAPVGPAPKGPDSAGFPGATPPPAKPKAPSPPVAPKAGGPEKPGELVFEDSNCEAETKYTYRIRSVLIPKEEGEQLQTQLSEPREYTTLERFSFAYVGGDAYRANIIVYIGPRDNPLGGRLFERIPIGGWVGVVPREFRKPSAPAAKPPTPPAAPAAGGPAATEKEKKAQAATERFVTRFILVGIEQGIYHSVPYTMRVSRGRDALGRPRFENVVAYRERLDRRVTLLELRKNRLHQLWLEPRATLPGAPPKAK